MSQNKNAKNCADYCSKEASSTSSTQPTYVDESGKVFTPADIVQGYKPKGKWKGHSLSDRVKASGADKKKKKEK